MVIFQSFARFLGSFIALEGISTPFTRVLDHKSADPTKKSLSAHAVLITQKRLCLIRQPNNCINKQLLFNSKSKTQTGGPPSDLLDQIVKNKLGKLDKSYKDQICREARNREC